MPDRTMIVKLSLARTSGKLDLSWLGLVEIPPAVFELDDLEARLCGCPGIVNQ